VALQIVIKKYKAASAVAGAAFFCPPCALRWSKDTRENKLADTAYSDVHHTNSHSALAQSAI